MVFVLFAVVFFLSYPPVVHSQTSRMQPRVDCSSYIIALTEEEILQSIVVTVRAFRKKPTLELRYVNFFLERYNVELVPIPRGEQTEDILNGVRSRRKELAPNLKRKSKKIRAFVPDVKVDFILRARPGRFLEIFKTYIDNNNAVSIFRRIGIWTIEVQLPSKMRQTDIKTKFTLLENGEFLENDGGRYYLRDTRHLKNYFNRLIR